eukprot:scaffold136951_cov73-Attheya_sp.AAC.4
MDFDALKIATQLTLESLIESLSLETTNEEHEVEVALAVTVAHCERAGDPVTGTEAGILQHG